MFHIGKISKLENVYSLLHKNERKQFTTQLYVLMVKNKHTFSQNVLREQEFIPMFKIICNVGSRVIYIGIGDS